MLIGLVITKRQIIHNKTELRLKAFIFWHHWNCPAELRLGN